jgi:hypothetical protein
MSTPRVDFPSALATALTFDSQPPRSLRPMFVSPSTLHGRRRKKGSKPVGFGHG